MKFGGEPNVFAVRVFVQQPSTRWYSGAGIYRHVWLTLTDPVHVAHWGTVATSPKVNDLEAAVRVTTEVENQGAAGAQVELETLIRDRARCEVVARTQSSRSPRRLASPATVSTVLQIPRPHRWSIADPVSLHGRDISCKVNGRVVDIDRVAARHPHDRVHRRRRLPPQRHARAAPGRLPAPRPGPARRGGLRPRRSSGSSRS